MKEDKELIERLKNISILAHYGGLNPLLNEVDNLIHVLSCIRKLTIDFQPRCCELEDIRKAESEADRLYKKIYY